MDEAERCDRLLLLREGRLVADDTPGGLRERTGTANLEDAFLRIVERDGSRGMSPRVTLATARRVLEQLRSDRRTIALLLLVPCVLMTLLRLVYDGQPAVFDRIGLQLLGIFPFVTMFLVTSVAMLRERTSGTLERLLTTPMAKLDLLLGYALAFGVAALAQAALASALTLGVLGLDVAGPVTLVLLVAVANALLGMALGLFVSAFAQTEFQAVQFMPAVVLPQILLCGLLAPREQMSRRARGDQRGAADDLRGRRDDAADPYVLAQQRPADRPGGDHAGRRRRPGPGRRDAAAPHCLRPAPVPA